MNNEKLEELKGILLATDWMDDDEENDEALVEMMEDETERNNFVETLINMIQSMKRFGTNYPEHFEKYERAIKIINCELFAE